MEWHRFSHPCSGCFDNGQSFQWRPWKKGDEEKRKQWIGVLGRRILVLSENDEGTIDYALLSTHTAEDILLVEQQLKRYFRIHLGFPPFLIRKWSKQDKTGHFARAATHRPHLRLLRLEPFECLLSFICSTNNHLARIQDMVDSLRKEYGDQLGEVDGVSYHVFPSLQQLARNMTDSRLRELKFGYRSAYLVKTVAALKEKGSNWLEHLARTTRLSGVTKSRMLQEVCIGVGPKVADLVVLHSMENGTDCVPVDVHVSRLYAKYYEKEPPSKAKKTITRKRYDGIANGIRQIFAPHPGWAQSFLYTAEMAQFDVQEKPKNDDKEDEEAIPCIRCNRLGSHNSLISCCKSELCSFCTKYHSTCGYCPTPLGRCSHCGIWRGQNSFLCRDCLANPVCRYHYQPQLCCDCVRKRYCFCSCMSVVVHCSSCHCVIGCDQCVAQKSFDAPRQCYDCSVDTMAILRESGLPRDLQIEFYSYLFAKPEQ